MPQGHYCGRCRICGRRCFESATTGGVIWAREVVRLDGPPAQLEFTGRMEPQHGICVDEQGGVEFYTREQASPSATAMRRGQRPALIQKRRPRT